MRGIISWFAHNHIAANLLMLLIFVVGTLSIVQMRKEFIPSFSLESVSISVPYPGAAPAEVENAICLRVEEAIDGLDGIKRLSSTASAGAASVVAEIHPDYDADEVLSEIKTRVDAITSFPADVERPVISKPSIRSPVIQCILSGPMDERNLRAQAEIVREEIAQLPEISQVEISATRPYEISIEISELALQRYQLSFDEIAQAIRRDSFDLPAGAIKSRSGDVLLRTRDQAYDGSDFADIIISSNPALGTIRLRDIAHIKDGFQDNDVHIELDGQNAITILAYRIGNQDILKIAESVRSYAAEKNQTLPPGSSLHIWRDESVLYQGRLDTLTGNAVGGLILVFIVLLAFLGPKLAFWVSLGIPISFMGAMGIMFGLDESLNMISMFAFLLVIGIVVDDAIVVGESVHRSQKDSDPSDRVEASIRGTWRVGKPVFFAVATTIIAFAPMLFLPGVDGKFWRIIPIVVIGCLIFSLIESLLILPAHLGHTSQIGRFFAWYGKLFSAVGKPIGNTYRNFYTTFNSFIENIIIKYYQPFLKRCLNWRYFTVACFITCFMGLIGLMLGERIKQVFFPVIEADFITVDLEMPVGTAIEATQEVNDRIIATGKELQKALHSEYGGEVMTHFYSMMGARTSMGRRSGGTNTSTHIAQIIAELDQEATHSISTNDIAKRWRSMCGNIPGVKSLSFESQFMSGNFDVQVQITGPSLDELRIVSDKICSFLGTFTGVVDIADNFPYGKDEIQLQLTDRGRALGIDQLSLARQIQSAFFGIEAQRIQRGRDEVRVYIRLPRDMRSSLADLMNLYIAHASERIPLCEIAQLDYGESYATINRQDRRRVVMVTAKIDHSKQNAKLVNEELLKHFNKDIKREHPLVQIKEAGKQEDRSALVSSLGTGLLIAMIAIYALIAIAFDSYLQPAVIMTAIPFGLIGAIGGHFIMGMPVSMLSILGMVALTGVVVNDSLVLVDGINRHRSEGNTFFESVMLAGHSRFRAIILTTLTTFFGLLPLMLETSVQAQFLIPMATSLAFGVVFATVITLVLVPALTLIVHDIHKLLKMAD